MASLRSDRRSCLALAREAVIMNVVGIGVGRNKTHYSSGMQNGVSPLRVVLNAAASSAKGITHVVIRVASESRKQAPQPHTHRSDASAEAERRPEEFGRLRDGIAGCVRARLRSSLP